WDWRGACPGLTPPQGPGRLAVPPARGPVEIRRHRSVQSGRPLPRGGTCRLMLLNCLPEVGLPAAERFIRTGGSRPALRSGSAISTPYRTCPPPARNGDG